MLMPAEALSLRGLPFLRRGERDVTQHHGGRSLWNCQEDERELSGMVFPLRFSITSCSVMGHLTPPCVPLRGPCTVETLNCTERSEGGFSPSNSLFYGIGEVST